MDTRLIQQILTKKENYGINKESIEKSLEYQLKNFGDDFKASKDLIENAAKFMDFLI